MKSAHHSDLAIDVLRNFVAIVDAGSMLRASSEAYLTQSALSLQMKGLSELIQAPVFERHGGRLRLAPAGETLLVYARRILELNDRAVFAIRKRASESPVRVGLAQDFAGQIIQAVVPRLLAIYPDLDLRIQGGEPSKLLSLFEGGLLDMLVGLGSPDDPAAVSTAEIAWLGDARLTNLPEIPLALKEAPCVFREAALAALEAAGRRYRIALESPASAVLRAAIDGGLALTPRIAAFAFKGVNKVVIPGASLGRVGIVVRHNPSAASPVLRLNVLVRNALAEFEGLDGR